MDIIRAAARIARGNFITSWLNGRGMRLPACHHCKLSPPPHIPSETKDKSNVVWWWWCFAAFQSHCHSKGRPGPDWPVTETWEDMMLVCREIGCCSFVVAWRLARVGPSLAPVNDVSTRLDG